MWHVPPAHILYVLVKFNVLYNKKKLEITIETTIDEKSDCWQPTALGVTLKDLDLNFTLKKRLNVIEQTDLFVVIPTDYVIAFVALISCSDTLLCVYGFEKQLVTFIFSVGQWASRGFWDANISYVRRKYLPTRRQTRASRGGSQMLCVFCESR